eukprot:CFRG7212T1
MSSPGVNSQPSAHAHSSSGGAVNTEALSGTQTSLNSSTLAAMPTSHSYQSLSYARPPLYSRSRSSLPNTSTQPSTRTYPRVRTGESDRRSTDLDETSSLLQVPTTTYSSGSRHMSMNNKVSRQRKQKRRVSESLSVISEIQYNYNEEEMSHEMAQKSHNRRYTERRAFHHVATKGLFARGNLRSDSIDSGSESDNISLYGTPLIEPLTRWQRICTLLYSFKFSSSTLLLLMGVMSGLFDYLTNGCIQLIRETRTSLVESMPSPHLQFAMWVSIGSILAWCAILLTRRVSPVAAGSGIPEMKVILAGAEIRNFFSPSTIIVKIVGLTLMLSSNLSIGKEGPFVHTSAGLAMMTMSLPGFTSLMRDKRALHQITAAVCSMGVASTFGAPFGGVLFSIEVMTEYYMVSTYWKAFMAATVGAIVVHYFRPYPYVPSYKDVSMVEWLLPTMELSEPSHILPTKKTQTDILQYNFFEFFFFSLIGLTCGLLGAGFVRLHEVLVSYRKWYLSHNARILYPYIVSFVCMIILYLPGEYTKKPINEAMGDFMYQGDMFEHADSQWGQTRVMVFKRLIAFIAIHFFLTPVCITLPAPTGVFLPLLGVGAAIGRIIGEMVHGYFPTIHRGGYAVVGAAAMGGGGTRTISSAMVLCEVTGAVEFLLPTLTATLIAISIGNKLSRSIYDSILYTKGLPYLPRLSRLPVNRNKVACEVMRKDIILIPQKMSWGDLARILLDEKKIKGSYPLVDDLRNMRLYGAVSRESLEVALYAFAESIFPTERMNDILSVDDLPPLGTSPLHSPAMRNHLHSNSTDTLRLSRLLEEEGLSGNIFALGITDDDIKVLDRHFLDVFSIRDLLIDPSPFQVVHLSPLSEVHFMFIMLRCSHLFVTKYGRLLGYIMLKDLMHNDQNTIHIKKKARSLSNATLPTAAMDHETV